MRCRSFDAHELEERGKGCVSKVVVAGLNPESRGGGPDKEGFDQLLSVVCR